LKHFYKGENDDASLATGFFCVRREEELIRQVRDGEEEFMGELNRRRDS
jgi:hypothetical protein